MRFIVQEYANGAANTVATRPMVERAHAEAVVAGRAESMRMYGYAVEGNVAEGFRYMRRGAAMMFRVEEVE